LEIGKDKKDSKTLVGTLGISEKMVDVNKEKSLVRQTPGLVQVKKWVIQAKELPRIITF